MDTVFTPVKDAVSRKRQLEFFHHNAVASWGGGEQVDSFAVLHPLHETKLHGLYVVCHSSGHDLLSCLGCTFAPNNHDIYRTPEELFGLYLDCRENETTDFWWGGNRPDQPVKAELANAVQPVEKRVFATVEWVLKNYPVDANRIYICGNSMGGSGALGLAMSRGDLFAAVKVNVPAGVDHALERMALAGANMPDPPVCFDYSAPNDKWSQGHEKLYRRMREEKFALYGYWGAFGHADNNSDMLAKNDLIHSFPWLSIRKNAAYPVFTDASTDNPNPWENAVDITLPGQVNAFFRWENVADEATHLEMKLFLVSDLATKFALPEQAVADVTLRRLQNFKVTPHQNVNWTFGEQHGAAEVGDNGVFTLPRLEITQTTKILSIMNSAK